MVNVRMTFHLCVKIPSFCPNESNAKQSMPLLKSIFHVIKIVSCIIYTGDQKHGNEFDVKAMKGSKNTSFNFVQVSLFACTKSIRKMSHACPRLIKLEHLYNNGMDNINLFKELFQWKKLSSNHNIKLFFPRTIDIQLAISFVTCMKVIKFIF